VGDVELGQQIAVRSHHHLVGGCPAHQADRYYLAHIVAGAVDPAST